MSATKVAIAGATGNLGPAVLKALKEAGFELTVLTRSTKNSFDSDVRVAQVDYTSLDSLQAALAGQDALVITLGHVGLEPQMNLINAAVAANVKRIIPSEFGSNTTNPKAAALPVFADKVAVQKRLKEIAAAPSSKTSYTLILNGPFFDWGLQVKFLINFAHPEVYDGGDRKISTTTLSGIGRAVAGVLKDLDSTRNKAVFVDNVRISQNDLLRIAGKEQVPKKQVSTADLEKEAFGELEKPNPNHMVFAFNLLKRGIFGEGYGSLFSEKDLWNDALGVPKLSEAEIAAIVSQYA
ncbi:hypothetical protein HFD88_002260 [Aspergillus terreus]|nr:hypothetical protein HFD88_002260 [Aspergillus terreus]